MAFNPFIGMDQPTLESLLASAQADLAAGKTTVSAEVPGIRNTSMADTLPIERIRLLLKALNLLAPGQYPIDQISPATQTRVIFGPAGNPPATF